MGDDALDALLDEIEAILREDVQTELSAVASEYADALDDATELVAARFSVSRIRDMWRRRVPQIMERLRSIVARGAEATADDLGEPLPDEWEDDLDNYVEATQALLTSVGDHMAATATRALAEGLSQGEDVDQLRQRLRTLFSAEGPQMGDVRAERIAMTEATRAWNAGTLAAAQAITGPERPLVKQWTTRRDAKVRQSHRDADGQIQLLDDAFDVGGFPMQYPGDPSAPADQTVGCRCILRMSARSDQSATASSDAQTGAMIALVPSEQDAARMALDGGERAEQLHVTVAILGEGADWGDECRSRIRRMVSQVAAGLSPIRARSFGVSLWNPSSDNPAWVWSISDVADAEGTVLEGAHKAVWAGLADETVPPNFTPWIPHVTAAYGTEDLMPLLSEKLGEVTFDRLRVAFAGEAVDYPLTGGAAPVRIEPFTEGEPVMESGDSPSLATWSTPEGTALAFENQQTGDSRVFAPGALYWEGTGPWPLQLQHGADTGELAGAIYYLGRDGDRITGDGVLYLSSDAGHEAAMLLAQGAPVGVSVDLDDVDMELVDRTGETYQASLLTASVTADPDGSWSLTGESSAQWHTSVSRSGIASESSRVSFTTDVDGYVPGGLFDLSAASGEGAEGGKVVDVQRSGDYLVRIVRARVRGASLALIPAFAAARIVLDDYVCDVPADGLDEGELEASAANNDYERVVRHVLRSLVPSTVAGVARFLNMPVQRVRRHLARAAKENRIMRISRGRYVPATPATPSDQGVAASATPDAALDDLPATLVASVTGSVDLPVASRDAEWDGDAAKERVFQWADGDTEKISRAFAYRVDDADPELKGSYKLGYADVVGGELTIIPRGAAAALAAVNGARGGADIPSDQLDGVRAKLEAVRDHVAEVTGEDERDEMEASAWSAMKDLPPMPVAWFREPTAAELPEGGPGVNYKDGRIFGWVARAGEPHAGFAKKVTIDTLGRIDTTHFLRQRFTLDDGSTVKAGAFTMNAGHHRDGAECETSACQFDDTRTVAGIITVGMNERGMWFSGAAAPWMSSWDRNVFMATQPSYHMKKGPTGTWQLRAVLSVPVPGHSSPLLASAVVERSQMALTASAAMAGQKVAEAASAEADALTDSLAAALTSPKLLDLFAAALEERQAQRDRDAAELAALIEEASRLEL
jgi:2'-5' RNA ligase